MGPRETHKDTPREKSVLNFLHLKDPVPGLTAARQVEIFLVFPLPPLGSLARIPERSRSKGCTETHSEAQSIVKKPACPLFSVSSYGSLLWGREALMKFKFYYI